MTKGKKGKGRGRGRPKDPPDSQREEQNIEPGRIRRPLNFCADEPGSINTGSLEQPEVNTEFPPLSQKIDSQKKQCYGNSSERASLGNVSAIHKPIQEQCNSEASVRPKQVVEPKPGTSLPRQRETSNGDVALKEQQAESLKSVMHLRKNSPDVSNTNIHASRADACVRELPRSASSLIIRRPNYGTMGTQIPIVANYFLLKGSGNDVYQYDVEMVDSSRKTAKPKTIRAAKKEGATQVEIQQKRNVGKQRRREIMDQLIIDKNMKNNYVFYDGQKNFYTLVKLGIEQKVSAEVKLLVDGKTKTYTVTVQPANKNGGGNTIHLDSLNEVCEGCSLEIPLEALMAFDALLCNRKLPFKEVNVGRSFFSFGEMFKSRLEGEVEIWKGYNQSVHLTKRGPAVVVNLAAKAFHSAGFVIEHACGVLGFDITLWNMRNDQIEKLKKSLANVKVEVTHLPYPRRYTVSSVTKLSAKELLVDIQGQKMSVAEFFSQKYKKLKFPDLPCLQMRSTGRPTYVPMEVCMLIPGQPKLGKLDRRQGSDMINKTAIAPEERFENISKYVETIWQTSAIYMKKAGFQMTPTPMNLIARVISPPALTYKSSSVQPDNRGVWRIDGANFSKTSNNTRWMLISFANQAICPHQRLVQLSRTLVTLSKNVGLCLDQPVAIKSFDSTVTTSKALSHAVEEEVDFVFAILTRTDYYHSYDELKFIADVKYGLITQCMEDIVVENSCGGPRSGQIINNLLSKLNIKLGGINHTISHPPSVSMKRTIVMGADAAHSPRGSKCPSIAAVVGSIDDVPFQYAVACKVQKNPDESKMAQEIILKMKDMTKHILRSYMEKNRIPPERIVFFRDGVSEGQFETVLTMELKWVQMACHEELGKILPVTFIVVQKRHQTRFRPRNPRDGIGRGGNVPPGTTVDTDVVHPVYFDFFLCSHEGIKGTSKSAHYIVLHDDNKFKADDLQKFCYDLCHVYARCNRSISIPAPAMNAHLAAARAKKYVDWHILKDTGSSSGYSSDDSYSLPQEVVDFVDNISTIKTPMFFV